MNLKSKYRQAMEVKPSMSLTWKVLNELMPNLKLKASLAFACALLLSVIVVSYNVNSNHNMQLASTIAEELIEDSNFYTDDEVDEIFAQEAILSFYDYEE